MVAPVETWQRPMNVADDYVPIDHLASLAVVVVVAYCWMTVPKRHRRHKFVLQPTTRRVVVVPVAAPVPMEARVVVVVELVATAHLDRVDAAAVAVVVDIAFAAVVAVQRCNSVAYLSRELAAACFHIVVAAAERCSNAVYRSRVLDAVVAAAPIQHFQTPMQHRLQLQTVAVEQ